MSLERLWLVVAVLAALSVASERLVEIVKGFLPALQKPPEGAPPGRLREPLRRALVHLLTVVSGMVVALLAAPAIPEEVLRTPRDPLGIVAIGLLTSGGSGFWNSILGYLEGVKGLRREVAELGAAAGKLPASERPTPVDVR